MRRQPEEVKRHILHITTLMFAVILSLLWVYSLGATLTNDDNQAKINKDLQPISALKANLIGGYNSIVNSQ